MRPHTCWQDGVERARAQLDARDPEDAAELYVEARWGRAAFGKPRRVRVWVEVTGTGRAARLFSVKVRPGLVFDCVGEICKGVVRP